MHWRQHVGVFTIVASLFPSAAWAIRKPQPADGVLPNFDIRVTGAGGAAAARSVDRSALDRLAALYGPRLRVRRDQEGRVKAVFLGAAPAAASAGQARGRGQGPAWSAERSARDFLQAHGAVLGLGRGDVETLFVDREISQPNLTTIEFRQRSRGLVVHGALVRAHFDANGRLFAVSSSAAPTARLRDDEPGLGPDEAIVRAVEHVRPDLEFAPVARQRGAGASRRTAWERGPLATEPEMELVAFPIAGELRPAWHAVIDPGGFPQKYDVIVDAFSGELLYRRNRVLYTNAAGNVLQSDATRLRDPRLVDPFPLGATASSADDPPGGCPPVTNHLGRDLVTPFRDAQSVLSASGLLWGNNVATFVGMTGMPGSLGTPDGDGGWSFEFPFGSAGASQTHLFFLANFLHDFFYDLGFDEAAGNFQADNFGRGGAAGDPLFAVARADGRNNATFEPKPDGQSPEMQMFLWDATGCWAEDVDGDGAADIDGDLDSDIVIHEYHHGVNHRLNTQFTGDEADAIGEGGSDFFAYSINDDTTLAEYASPPYGIRRVNGRTYGSWACWFDIICEPHDNGEIWANVLWDLRERFRADRVGGSEATGIDTSHAVYIDGLKLSPPAPTMLDLRDAMVAADAWRRPSDDPLGSVNGCRIWEVFALRGMGFRARDTNETGTLSVVEDFTMPPECPALPAPAVVTITATDATASEAGGDTGAFTVTRGGDTTQSLTVYLGSPTGNAAEGVDYAVLPASVTIAAGQTSTTIVLVPIDDEGVESNESASLALEAGPGYRVGVPASATITVKSDDVAPDLVVTTLTGPATAAAGGSLLISLAVKNQGTDEAPATRAQMYLSVNAVIDAADAKVGTTPVPALALGASHAASVTVALPVDVSPGSYYLLAQADADNVAREISEGNNVRAMLVRVGPDLTVTALAVPSVAAPGAAISVNDTVKNAGGGAAGQTATIFHLSKDAIVDDADVVLGTRVVPSLAADAASSGTTVVTLPQALGAGAWYVIARADAANVVVETSETNNTRTAQVKVGPDLSISSLTAPTVVAAGASIAVNETVKNQGGGASPASTTRFYFSNDANVGPDDVPLGARAVPALAAGASSAGSTLVTVPAQAAVGTYYLLALADGDLVVEETNEGNNIWRLQVKVGPDLLVSDVTGVATADAGSTVTVGATIKNQGGGAAAASIAHVFLSSNSSLDASDLLLGEMAIPTLAAGATRTASTSVRIPDGTVAGTYYVLVKADATGDVAETSETNNVGSEVVRIGPNLVISTLTVSPTVTGAGLTVTVTEATRNSGGGVAASSTTRLFLSVNSAFDAGDTPLATRAVPGLSSGATSSSTATVVIPPDAATGSWFVLAVADADSRVAETSETDNVRSAAIRVGPDLKVTALTGPKDVATGVTFTVSDVSKNDGGSPAGASTTRYYLSVNNVVDASDVVLGSRQVPALGAGAASSGSTVLILPAGTAPGRYYVIAQADGEHEVGEVFENNNTFALLVTVG